MNVSSPETKSKITELGLSISQYSKPLQITPKTIRDRLTEQLVLESDLDDPKKIASVLGPLLHEQRRMKSVEDSRSVREVVIGWLKKLQEKGYSDWGSRIINFEEITVPLDAPVLPEPHYEPETVFTRFKSENGHAPEPRFSWSTWWDSKKDVLDIPGTALLVIALLLLIAARLWWPEWLFITLAISAVLALAYFVARSTVVKSIAMAGLFIVVLVGVLLLIQKSRGDSVVVRHGDTTLPSEANQAATKADINQVTTALGSQIESVKTEVSALNSKVEAVDKRVTAVEAKIAKPAPRRTATPSAKPTTKGGVIIYDKTVRGKTRVIRTETMTKK